MAGFARILSPKTVTGLGGKLLSLLLKTCWGKCVRSSSHCVRDQGCIDILHAISGGSPLVLMIEVVLFVLVCTLIVVLICGRDSE